MVEVDAPAFTFAGKSLPPRQFTGPGPAAYSPYSAPTKGPSYSLTGKPSKDIYGSSKTPAPGEHDTNRSAKVTHERAPAFSMGTRTSAKHKKDAFTPGPQAYNTRRPAGGAKWTFGMRGPTPGEAPIQKDAPAPHDYQAAFTSTNSRKGKSKGGPAYSMRPRTTPHGTLQPGLASPGPASYYPATNRKGGVTLGARRFLPQVDTPTGGPGPGEYNVRGTEEKANRRAGYSFGGRTSNKVREMMPGPGAYDTRTKSSVKGFSLGDRKIIAEPNKSPGPAAYLPKRPGSSGNGFSIGVRPAKRSTKSRMEPGPGAYSVANKGKPGPSYSMGLKSNHGSAYGQAQEGPGPGEYRTVPRKRKEGPAFVLGSKGKAGGSMGYTSPSPGPAAYNVNGPRSGAPSYSLYFRRPLREGDTDTPGPGHYNVRATKAGSKLLNAKGGQRMTAKI